MFKDFLDKKNCFKLILGASNKDIEQIEKLCSIYYEAGCRFFDVSASVEAVKSAKKAGKGSYICVSVGGKNDPHISKCYINEKKCTKCGKCKSVCLQEAIYDKSRCIGCAKCLEVCKSKAIKQVFEYKPMEDIISPLINLGIDCIEFHISDASKKTLDDFKTITSLFKGAISVCLSRKKLSDEKIIKLLKKMKKMTSNLFMVQADGNPMSGGKDDYRTTLQAVALAAMIEKENITPYIFVSGGTNSKTAKLIKKLGIDVAGIAMGSFARKEYKKAHELVNY